MNNENEEDRKFREYMEARTFYLDNIGYYLDSLTKIGYRVVDWPDYRVLMKLDSKKVIIKIEAFYADSPLPFLKSRYEGLKTGYEYAKLLTDNTNKKQNKKLKLL